MLSANRQHASLVLATAFENCPDIFEGNVLRRLNIHCIILTLDSFVQILSVEGLLLRALRIADAAVVLLSAAYATPRAGLMINMVEKYVH